MSNTDEELTEGMTFILDSINVRSTGGTVTGWFMYFKIQSVDTEQGSVEQLVTDYITPYKSPLSWTSSGSCSTKVVTMVRSTWRSARSRSTKASRTSSASATATSSHRVSTYRSTAYRHSVGPSSLHQQMYGSHDHPIN